MAVGLSLPHETFARLTPGPYLHAHLKADSSIRPNGRRPQDFRPSTVNINSLTHCHGSAVVRAGDTAIVCGIRGEILLASDIPRQSTTKSTTDDENDVVNQLGLLVPNFELSTGCSPAHLPENPPGTLAQSLTYRLSSLLETSKIIPISSLQIQHLQPADPELGSEAEFITKAYWTLYIDILCIALDGNPFDVAWTAIVSALRNVRLPRAYWDADQESILCSPLAAEAKSLEILNLPMASTFAIYSTATPLKDDSQAERYILADPDGLEEGVCRERLTVVCMTNEPMKILKVEKSGGDGFDVKTVTECIELAQSRTREWRASIGA